MKPWAKLWRRESARFRSLPLSARAIASYVLKFVDDEGSIPLGKRDPVTAVALAVAADPSERRWLRHAVTALVGHEYLVVRDGLLVVGNFPRYQEDVPQAPRGRERSTPKTVAEHSSDVSPTVVEQTTDNGPTMVRHEIDVSVRNETLAQNVLSISEEIIDRRRENQTRVREEFRTFEDKILMHEIEKTFSGLRDAAGAGTWKRSGTYGYQNLVNFTDWANDVAQGETKSARLESVREAILGWLMESGEKVVKARWPLTWLSDPGAMQANYRNAKKGKNVAPVEVVPTDRTSLARAELEAASVAAEQAEGTNAYGPATERLERARRAVRDAERGNHV